MRYLFPNKLFFTGERLKGAEWRRRVLLLVQGHRALLKPTTSAKLILININ